MDVSHPKVKQAAAVLLTVTGGIVTENRAVVLFKESCVCEPLHFEDSEGGFIFTHVPPGLKTEDEEQARKHENKNE